MSTMGKVSLWTRDQQLVAFRLYCGTPFGKLHKSNPDIIRIAALIGRTPDALSMKACNFASLDPKQQQRNIKGLRNRSSADEALWAEFDENAEVVAAEAEAAYARFTGRADTVDDPEWRLPVGPTDREALVRVRRVQSFFRDAVLTSYQHRCAVTGLAAPELLTASHIIPWNVSVERRAHPANGICLNALLDRAFDRGLITFDEQLRTVVSQRLRSLASDAPLALPLDELHGVQIRIPKRFQPASDALEYHRSSIFRD
jgi:hypothetical protein